MKLVKYPRTRHIEGSRLQPGDDDIEAVRFETLRGRPLVVEEKLDGANAALSFDAGGNLLLQSRGHYLLGGEREKHFALFKSWAAVHRASLRQRLGSRYVVYGEWLYAKHTVFYDRLPHYFMEFDVWDREAQVFLSTDERRKLLDTLPVASVPVLGRGAFESVRSLTQLVTLSLYKSEQWRDRLVDVARAEGLDADRVGRETDPSSLAEGLYLKHEDDGRVLGRYKYVRADFLTSVVDSKSHWLSRPIVPNQLALGVDLYQGSL